MVYGVSLQLPCFWLARLLSVISMLHLRDCATAYFDFLHWYSNYIKRYIITYSRNFSLDKNFAQSRWWNGKNFLQAKNFQLLLSYNSYDIIIVILIPSQKLNIDAFIINTELWWASSVPDRRCSHHDWSRRWRGIHHLSHSLPTAHQAHCLAPWKVGCTELIKFYITQSANLDSICTIT